MRPGRFVLALLVSTAGCMLGTEAIPPGRDAVQVSAVLDPSLADQTVLVERVHSGDVAVDSASFDPADPVATGFGIPVSGAHVAIVGPAGDSVVLEEDLATRGRGAGVYRFSNTDVPGGTSERVASVVPGAHYILHVVTTTGESVTGETTVPRATPAPLPTMVVDTLDRGGAPMRIAWPRVSGAAEYGLIVESPRAPYILMLPDTEATLSGSVRDPRQGLAPVFAPGFRQALTVVVMDRNFYDYYRPERSGDADVRSHIVGGYGLFGSVVPIAAHTLEVVAAGEVAPAGTWRLVDSSAPPHVARTLRLYVDDEDGSGPALTGNYRRSDTGAPSGVLGEAHGDSVHLALLAAWTALDTLDRLDGTIRATTMDVVQRTTGLHVRYSHEQ